MTPARFSVQTLVVLALIALVSWPQHRQVRAGSVWQARDRMTDRVSGNDMRRRDTAGKRYLIGYGSASEYTLGADGADALRRKLYANDLEGRRRPTPREVLALGGKINGIVGYTRSARNAPLAFARVVLRNLTTGQVEARGVADERGFFTFLDVVPSGYVVELLDDMGNVIATSEPIAIAVNDLRQTTLRAAGRPLFASFGGGLAPTAPDAIDAAATQGVNRIAAPERCASPPCSTGTQ